MEDEAYGLMQQPLTATLVPEERLGKSSGPPPIEYQQAVQQQQQQVSVRGSSNSGNYARPPPGNNINDPTLSRNPMMMRVCPSCGQQSRTKVSTYPAWQTWVSSVRTVLFL
jgi:hypothetical protein